MGVAVGVAQIIIGVVALYVGWRALRISRDVRRDAASERERADLRDLLMWMQTLLNAAPGIVDARFGDNEDLYEDRQRCMLTALATAGLRDRLPETRALAERPFSELYGPGIVELSNPARHELHDALEYVGDRAYADRCVGPGSPAPTIGP